MEWCEVATGQVQPAPTSMRSFEIKRLNVGEVLFQQDPALHSKLVEGRPLNWNEVARAADVLLCAVSQDALLSMFGARSLRDIRRAIETMLSAQRLCTALSPRLNAPGSVSPGAAKAATGAMRALLTLPGR